MNDIIMMLVSALGAVASAAVILAGIGAAMGAGTAALAAVGSTVVTAVPVGVCLGGAAYAASKTGYGGLRD